MASHNVTECDFMLKMLLIMGQAPKLQVTDDHINVIDVLKCLAKHCMTVLNKLSKDTFNSDPTVPQEKPLNTLMVIIHRLVIEGNLNSDTTL